MQSSDQTSVTTAAVTNWDDVFSAVNAWRGACLHHFSSVEMAVTETLLALSAASETSGSIRLRQLIGQRFEDLASAIGPGGAFSSQGSLAYGALMLYRDRQEAFRALLCHGTIKVTVDQAGQWTLIVKCLSIKSRQPERTAIVIEQPEALARLVALKNEGQKVASLLGQLRKSIQS